MHDRAARDCIRGRHHIFHADSGWCIRGCGNRDDGRIVTWLGGVIDPGPTYTADELAELRARRALREADVEGLFR